MIYNQFNEFYTKINKCLYLSSFIVRGGSVLAEKERSWIADRRKNSLEPILFIIRYYH